MRNEGREKDRRGREPEREGRYREEGKRRIRRRSRGGE